MFNNINDSVVASPEILCQESEHVRDVFEGIDENSKNVTPHTSLLENVHESVMASRKILYQEHDWLPELVNYVCMDMNQSTDESSRKLTSTEAQNVNDTFDIDEDSQTLTTHPSSLAILHESVVHQEPELVNYVCQDMETNQSTHTTTRTYRILLFL
jgi:hypothetical protein